MNIKDVMLSLDKFPVIKDTVILKEALEEMSNKKIGIACVINSEFKLLGIITDGDIRRKILSIQKPLSSFFIDDCIDHAILSPKTIDINDTLETAVDLMGEKKVWDLPVLENGILKGLLHLHPLVELLLSKKDKI
jgi:arabinose-5-phosphate isomerase